MQSSIENLLQIERGQTVIGILNFASISSTHPIFLSYHHQSTISFRFDIRSYCVKWPLTIKYSLYGCRESKKINISGYNVIYAEYYGFSYIIREIFACVCVDFISVTLALLTQHFCVSAIYMTIYSVMNALSTATPYHADT